VLLKGAAVEKPTGAALKLAAPFLAIRYVLGILIPAAVGAWAGPRLLHW
jgi:hypothetical protein